MAIYTKNGDGGFTRLADGKGLSKSDVRMDAIGDIDELNCHLGALICQIEPMRFFILPGGHPVIAAAQIARTVCRRAERSLIRWVQIEEKEDYATAIAYLNRLSDYLFMMCRYLHHSLGIPEIPWNSGK